MGNAADLQLSTEGAVAPSSPAVSVDVTVTPVLSCALAHNGVPVVSRITLTGGHRTLRGATLRLSAEDAEGAIGPAVERLVDLDAGRTTVLDDLGLVVDPAALRPVASARPGRVRVELESDGRLLAQQHVPVQVLGAAQWTAAPLPLALELLAAHVQPGHPAVAALHAEAAELLEEGTGSGSITGYADGAERVDEVVEALTWAMRRRNIRCVESPARWADQGQPVRTPGEVLDGRAATSLDTVVTLAAALERAGLRPQLWLVADQDAGREHAFLGYWREEPTDGTPAPTDVAALVDLVDRGLIRLVETTLLTDRGNTGADLHGPAYTAWLAGDRSRVVGVTDVHRARREGVRSLPVPSGDRDDTVAVGQVSPAGHDTPLDLHLADELLHSTGLPLTVPPDAVPTLADLVGGGTTLTLLPGDRIAGLHVEPGPRSARDLPAQDLTDLLTERRSVHVDVPGSGYLPALRDLAHRARTVVEETGANDLHLALGSLVWEVDGRTLRSPLVLLPVVLGPAPQAGGYRIAVDESGAATVNACLLEQLRRRHGLIVPGLAAGDGPAVDLPSVLHAVRAVVAGHSLPWRVEATAELAVLPAAAFRQWQDLAEHGSEYAARPLVGRLLPDADEASAAPAPQAPVTADAVDPADLDELAARCPLPADAAQLAAVADAVAGRTFVLEGAPGTGKSQTIANVAARAVAEGKRVLVVAGKRAALDAVARRLDAVGLGPVTLRLHDQGGRPAVVRAQLRAALEHSVEADEQGLAADADDLRSATRSLARYAQRLHEENPAGLSVYSAHTAVLAADRDVAPLPVTTAFAARADADIVTAVRRALALLPDIADLARPSAGHAWGFLDTVELDITAVQQAAVAVDTAIRDLPGEGGLAAAVRAARTPEDLDTLVHLLSGPRVGLDVLDEVRTQRWSAATTDVTSETAALVGGLHAGFDVVSPEVLALPLADLSAAAQAAAAAGAWARRGRLRTVREDLVPLLRPGVTLKPKDVPALIDSVGRVQAAVHGIAGRAARIPGLQVPAGWNPFLDSGRFVLDAEVRWLRRAAAAVDGATGFPGALRRFLSAGPVTDPAAAGTVARLRDTLRHLLEVCSSDSAQLVAWCGEHGLVLRWTMTRPERGVEYVHPMSLRRWVSLLDTLEPLRLAGLLEARTQLRNGLVRAEDAVRAFDRGLAEASVVERQAATGLDTLDAGQHERTVSRFTAASRAVRSHLTTALPAAVLAARPSEAAPGDGRVTALRQELAEHRRGRGVRDLFSAYGDLITAAMPCVLASPDAVTRFLPPTADQFDLVVFDEASRLRVADAVGALARARSAVVVGDSRQLPPASAGQETEDDESLLSAGVRAGLPRRWLSWHHRSQDESLIAFSNVHSYDGRLSSFPAPGGCAVSLLQVGGTFLQSGPGAGTNPVEAETVVAQVLRRFQLTAPDVPSIGVVTVHAAQRTLIETLLREAGDERVVAALDRTDGEGLFVKDLENVQGDEADVVLLCTGAGRPPLDLGPLSRRGGERRLNVAITRARRQVVVITSFAPEQLRADETASTGVRHLRAYLELAARGTDALPRSPRAPGAGDRHREEIAAALRERGLVVHTDVGLSDFRIDLTVARAEQPDTPLLAVLLDGPAWAGRATVGDRDGLPVAVLTERGWPAVERVWLPAWLAGRDEVLDRLVTVVAAATPPATVTPPVDAPVLAPVLAPVVAAGGPEVEPDPQPSYDGPLAEVIPLRPTAPATPRPAKAPAPQGPLEGELPFRPWTPKPAGQKKQLDQLADPAVARVVRRVLTAGVKAEGPVHRDRLTRIAAAAFGLSRVTEARRDALLALLPRTATVDGDVVWPAGVDRDTWSSFRRQAGSADRPLEHVSPQELGNAMVALCRAGAGMTRDELFLRTVDVFGSRRRTPAQLPLLETALAAAIERGRLTEGPDGLVSA